MPETIKQGKQPRKDFCLFYSPADETLELIGKGIEELSIEQGAEINTVKDVTGSNDTSLDAYEKTTALDPIYVAGGNKFSEKLDEIEEKELIGDDVILDFVWAKLYKTTEESKVRAWKQKAVVELTSFGGDIKGVNAPCTLHWIGERTYGTLDPSTKQFTPDSAAAAAAFKAAKAKQ